MKVTRLRSDPQLDTHQRFVSLRRALGEIAAKNAFLGPLSHEEEFDLVGLGDRQLHRGEGLKSALLILADGALDGAFVLALHEVDNDGLVSLQVQLPVRVRFLLVGALQLGHLDILLLPDAIHVLVQLIEQLGEKLGGVVLVVPHEHQVVLAEGLLEVARIHVAIAARLVPHLIVKPGQVRDDLAFGAQWVLLIDLARERHREQVLAKAVKVGKALQSTVHVTRVAQVVQPDNPVRRITLHLRIVALQLLRMLALALMVGFVALLALFIAIGVLFTAADRFERVIIVAIGASADLGVAIVEREKELLWLLLWMLLLAFLLSRCCFL